MINMLEKEENIFQWEEAIGVINIGHNEGRPPLPSLPGRLFFWPHSNHDPLDS